MSSPPSSVQEKPAYAAAYVRPKLGRAYKAILLTLFCGAEFMDAFAASALFPAIPFIERDLNISVNEITWEFSAFSATFAGFLLISGRVSDIYSSKWTFIAGAFCAGMLSLGSGLIHDKVGQFVLRALTGIAGAMTVPSALSLIIEWFPEKDEQEQAIALFGGSSGLGSVLGIIIGAFFTQWASWKWIFYFITIVFVPIAVVSAFVVPQSAPRTHKPSIRRLDIPGVSLLTGAMILFIYAVTSGSATTWGKAGVIAPLVISLVMGLGFFIVESKLPLDIASLPPHIWFYPNVVILFMVATLPFLWWCGSFYQLMPLFQETYHWSTVMTGVHFLPMGIVSTGVAAFCSNLVKYMNPKWSILGGSTLVWIATIILPFADTSAKYWSHLFPAFVIGTSGTMITYTNANIAIFQNTPPEIAGTVGAIFNSGLQLGLALGLAIITSIVQSQDKKKIAKGEAVGYSGIADGYWFIFAWVTAIIVCLLIFYKVDAKTPAADVEAVVVPESRSEATLAAGEGVLDISGAKSKA